MMLANTPRLAGLRRLPRLSVKAKIFLGSACLAFAAVMEQAWIHRTIPVEIKELAPGISVTSQLDIRAIRDLREDFATVIDLRPDGEALGQPPSADIAGYCKVRGLQFAYVPVPHGTIPDSQVRKLQEALTTKPKPISARFLLRESYSGQVALPK